MKRKCKDCGKKITKSSKLGRCSSCAKKGKLNPIFGKKRPNMKGKNHPRFGKYHTTETKIKMSQQRKGKNNPSYIDGRCSKVYFCECGEELSDYRHKRCGSCAQQLKWEDKEYNSKMRKKLSKSLKKSPNKSEKLLYKLLQYILPKEYKFVGNGNLIIGSFCPDFVNINGQKKIIEMYGDYWHNLPKQKKSHKRRIKTYKKYGYKTLIIWEKELKQFKKLGNKIKRFNSV